jgi:hypothetical protein
MYLEKLKLDGRVAVVTGLMTGSVVKVDGGFTCW